MKLFLISFVSIFLSLFVPLNTNINNNETFLENCKKGYNSYHVLYIEETNQYNLQIIEGEINNEVTYSINFITSTPNEYDLVLKYQGSSKYLYPEEDSRGDVSLYNMKFSKNMNVEIKTKGTTTFSYEIKIKNIDEYNTNDNILTGDGLGLETSEVKGVLQNNLVQFLSIIFTVIIIISIIIILILYSTKKGLFNKDVVDKEFAEQHRVRDDIQSFIKEQNQTFEVEAEEIEEEKEVKEVYEKIKEYDDEERDISLLLKEKGYNTNYNTLLTHEKNEIMLELMRMKDFKEITEKEYKEEIIKLWM